jgi:hypothetical protein
MDEASFIHLCFLVYPCGSLLEFKHSAVHYVIVGDGGAIEFLAVE